MLATGTIIFLVTIAPMTLFIQTKSSKTPPKYFKDFSPAKNLCPSAQGLFEDKIADLLAAIGANIDFHQRGGNLRSIADYLNRHQQSTLDSLGIMFTPRGKNNPIKDTIQHLRQFYLNNEIKRGGYGQPLPGMLTSIDSNQMVEQALFEKRWINVIEPPSRERHIVGVGHIGPECSRNISFSRATYEEKSMCLNFKESYQDSDEYRSSSCDIFSIGSNDQWGFENEIHQKLPGCTTHTFDCTIKSNSPRNKPDSLGYKFYPYCIGSEDATLPYLPYHKLVAATLVQTAPKLLKMDIEGFEYNVLETVLSGDPTFWPEQIMMEVHWATRMVKLPWMTRTRTAGEIAMFFGMLFNHGGYIVANSRVFDGCEPCMEVLLVKVLC